MNMSLSDGGNYAQNWFAYDGGVGEQITNLIGQLKTLNIPVVSATGNNFTGQQGEDSLRLFPGSSASRPPIRAASFCRMPSAWVRRSAWGR